MAKTKNKKKQNFTRVFPGTLRNLWSRCPISYLGIMQARVKRVAEQTTFFATYQNQIAGTQWSSGTIFAFVASLIPA